jgi:hypothetical protein
VARPETPIAPVRRTTRVHIALPVLVRGMDFRENTSTVAVSAYGCLVMLTAKVAQGDQVWLLHPKTAEEIPGRVVSIGKQDGEKTPVGIEFSEASPLFWRINFPPDDWLTSVERKRPTSGSPKS